jgi:hypothetical protein
MEEGGEGRTTEREKRVDGERKKRTPFGGS